VKGLSILLVMLALTGLPAVAQAPATVQVTCAQGAALIVVDHVMVGHAPATLTVAAGPHQIRIALNESYEPWEQTVEVPAGGTVVLDIDLARTSPSLFKEALAAYQKGDAFQAEALFEAALKAPGKKSGDIPFYLGLLDERRKDYGAAEQHYLQFVSTFASSPSGQYRLGLARQMMGQDPLAVTAYKSALTSMAPLATAIMQASGQPTSERIAQLQGAGGDPAAIELAYLHELKGSMVAAREGFRGLVERLAASGKVDLSSPHPAGLPVALPLPEAMRPIPATPGAVVFVSSSDAAAVADAWTKAVRTSAMVGGVSNGWIGLASRVFEHPDSEAAQGALKSLSGRLGTDVVLLSITGDGRSWYFYWQGGRLQDRYCSNPGRMGEVDYKTLRSWSGRPDVIVRICRGTPLSRRGPGYVTITDLNAILYFYYPEMRLTRPAAYRSPVAFMKLMVQLIGVSSLPQQFSAFAAAPGWRKI